VCNVVFSVVIIIESESGLIFKESQQLIRQC